MYGTQSTLFKTKCSLAPFYIPTNPTANKRRQKYWNVIVCGVYTKLLFRFRVWWWEYSENGVILNVFTQLIYKTHLNYTLSFVSFHSIYKPLLLHLNFTILLFQWHSFIFLFALMRSLLSFYSASIFFAKKKIQVFLKSFWFPVKWGVKCLFVQSNWKA